ncbi:MAG: gamma-glutamyltransferase family protein [Candidatus Nitrospinota bacterium M3_3B_026]
MIERGFAAARPVEPQRIAASRHGAAATAHYRATEAAVEILEMGGLAVDAAVAAAYALGVVEPFASGLGGQTMMMIYTANSRKTIALDGSSRAPHRVIPGEYLKKDLLRGHGATTVPSTPAVLEYARRSFGKLKRRQVLAPAIRFAEEGFEVSSLMNRLTKRELKKLRKSSAARFFLKDGRRPYPAGEILKQPVLAETLKRFSKNGPGSFYHGKIARVIHEDMVENGGLIRKDDLAQIPWPVERRPISCRFGAWKVITFPPPGAGRPLIEMLNILDRLPERLRDPDTPEAALALAAVIRQSQIDRKDRPFDPTYYPQRRTKKMLSTEYAQTVADKVRDEIERRGDTTHLSVMDRFGNVVALTQSIERVYGSFEAAPGLGFLYNNYMSAFEYGDIRHPHYLRPAAVPWASVAPTIVFLGRKPWLALGSPGSERIAAAIAQVLLRLRAGHSPLEAVAAARMSCSLDGKVSLEATRMRSDIIDALEAEGYETDIRKPYSFYLGCVQMVMRDGAKFIAVADPRRDGSAGGARR